MEYKIYNYIKNVLPEQMSESPSDINYNTIGLHKKRTFVKGELIETKYYGKFDLATKEYDDLILIENRIYNRTEDGFVYKRDLTSTWYKIDNNAGETKTTEKFYSSDESIKEGETRRSNIVSRLKLEIFGLLGQANAYDFLTKVFTDLGLYKDGFKGSLLNKVSTLDESYLDDIIPDSDPNITIRNYITEELTF